METDTSDTAMEMDKETDKLPLPFIPMLTPLKQSTVPLSEKGHQQVMRMEATILVQETAMEMAMVMETCM